MKKTELQTPAILVDLDILDYNIKRFQSLCNMNGKQLWPMIKTHKSTEIVKMQEAAQVQQGLFVVRSTNVNVFAI